MFSVWTCLNINLAPYISNEPTNFVHKIYDFTSDCYAVVCLKMVFVFLTHYPLRNAVFTRLLKSRWPNNRVMFAALFTDITHKLFPCGCAPMFLLLLLMRHVCGFMRPMKLANRTCRLGGCGWADCGRRSGWVVVGVVHKECWWWLLGCFHVVGLLPADVVLFAVSNVFCVQILVHNDDFYSIQLFRLLWSILAPNNEGTAHVEHS